MMTRRRMLTASAGVAAVGAGTWWALTGPSYDEASQSTWAAQTATSGNDLGYLVHYATLAANSHNTQPWLFSQSGARVIVAADLSRSTPVVDPDGHHLFASLGCAAENLMLAAAAAGTASDLTFVADGAGWIEIDFSGTTTKNPLFDIITQRQCTRSDFDSSSVSSQELGELAAAAKVDGCEIIFIPQKDRIEQALELFVAANTAQVEDPAFRAELKSWLRFSAPSAIASRDGLYAGCSGNPALPQWLGNSLFGLLFRAASENDRYARQIRSSSGLAVFVTDRDDKPHWVQAGRSYQRFALRATSLGLRHAFINQLVEVASLRPAFSKWLGIGDRRPDLVIRYGRAPAMPKSLRRSVVDVIATA